MFSDLVHTPMLFVIFLSKFACTNGMLYRTFLYRVEHMRIASVMISATWSLLLHSTIGMTVLFLMCAVTSRTFFVKSLVSDGR